MKNPKYRLTICFTDNETTDMFADKVLFYDDYISISRNEESVMIVPFSNIKYLLSKKFNV